MTHAVSKELRWSALKGDRLFQVCGLCDVQNDLPLALGIYFLKYLLPAVGVSLAR